MTLQKSQLRHLLLWLILMEVLFYIAGADVGTATSYNPPYIPSACYGNDRTQFPANNMFAAAGEGIWDNGAACGRQYLVRCLSSSTANACKSGQVVQVKVVDRGVSISSSPSKTGTTLILSANAFRTITNPSANPSDINIEYRGV